MRSFVIVHQKDNVATALQNLQKGQIVAGVELLEDIQSGHKFALQDICMHGLVIKYGEPIASAIEAIKAGQWVHIHNTAGIRGRGDKQ